jgi:MoaA/NifB/PqqE/SkfB family radical SAM enzyme
MNEDSPSKSGDLDVHIFLEKLKEWIDEKDKSAFDIVEIRLTGGEPMLSLPHIYRISTFGKTYGLKMGVNTNGYFVTSRNATQLRLAGLEVMKISVDAIDNHILAKFRGKAAHFESIEKATKFSLKNNLMCIWRFTLAKLNQSQLIPVYESANSLGVDLLQVKPVIRSGRAVNYNAFLSEDEIIQNFKKLKSLMKNGKTKVKALCWPENASGGLETERCGSINKVYVATNLDVSVCNYVNTNKRIGSLYDNSFEDILNKRSELIEISENKKECVSGCPQFPLIS